MWGHQQHSNSIVQTHHLARDSARWVATKWQEISVCGWPSVGNTVPGDTRPCSTAESMVTNPCSAQLTGHGQGRLLENTNCGNTSQAGQDPIALGLYKFRSRSGPSSGFHLIITQASSHWERSEGKLPKKFRVGASHYLTYSTTKRPGLLNSRFSTEGLDHST